MDHTLSTHRILRFIVVAWYSSKSSANASNMYPEFWHARSRKRMSRFPGSFPFTLQQKNTAFVKRQLNRKESPRPPRYGNRSQFACFLGIHVILVHRREVRPRQSSDREQECPRDVTEPDPCQPQHESDSPSGNDASTKQVPQHPQPDGLNRVVVSHVSKLVKVSTRHRTVTTREGERERTRNKSSRPGSTWEVFYTMKQPSRSQ